MGARGAWRRATCFSCFLLVVGVSEYLIVLQLHGSLHVGEEEEEVIAAGKSLWLRRGEAGWEEAWMHARAGPAQHEHSDGAEGRQEKDGHLDPWEVRVARELHDLRLDRLSNFQRRTGSLVADQQQSNFEQRQHALSGVDGEKQPQREKQQQQKLQQKVRRSGDHLSQMLNLSRLVDSVLNPESRKDRESLRQLFDPDEGDKLKDMLDRFYSVYAAEGGRESRGTAPQEKESDGDYGEEYGLEEEGEEEEDYRRVFDPEDFVVRIGADGRVNVSRKPLEPEVLVENTTLPTRNITQFEKAGLNILLTVRTTVSNHRKRLPLLFETWLTKVNTSQVVLVTDGDDPFTRLWTSVKGMHYVDVKCGNSYSREQLCCKAGSELALMFREENKAYDWICHTDDDMYVNVRNLISLLSGFDPRKDPIYFGRSGSPWHEPRRVKRKAQLSKPGKKYHFAVGGMYCLSRAMLEKTRQWLVGGEAFSKTCSLTREPEDVTVGLIVAMQNFSLSRTERINTHGLHLASNVDPYTLADQVAISYGYGSVRWGEDPYNAVYVPDALFTLQEDESQFRSLHCLLYPSTSWCLQQREMVQEMRLSTTDYDMDYSDNTNE